MGNCLREHGDGDPRNRAGVILLITLVILVILATLGYTVTARVATRRHRDQYVIDRGQARHASASALKCALMMIPQLDPQLIGRPNEADFSDVFAMNELEYQEFLAEYKRKLAAEAEWAAQEEDDQADMNGVDEVNDVNDTGLESLTIPGPYGPPWPFVVEPLECEIGSAKVRIEIEDENAKYPLHWAIVADEQWKALADVGFVTFCEWMGYTATEIGGLREDLARLAEIRPFQLEFKPMAAPAQSPASLRRRTSRAASAAAARRTAVRRRVISPADQMEQQTADFAKLFHSSLIDADLLARPSIVSDDRNESAMKYLGLWATGQVNVNTAPRHVLEAALMLGSAADAPQIAEEIIRQRQVKPFASIDELKNGVLRYAASIEKCKAFLTTTSSVLTIRVTAFSGSAKSTIVAAVRKEGDNVKQIGIVSD